MTFEQGELVRIDTGEGQYIARYSEKIEGVIHKATDQQKADWLRYTTENDCDVMPLITTPTYNYVYGEEVDEWAEIGHQITILGGKVTININYGREKD